MSGLESWLGPKRKNLAQLPLKSVYSMLWLLGPTSPKPPKFLLQITPKGLKITWSTLLIAMMALVRFFLTVKKDPTKEV